ncbi:replication-associated recombination protein A [Rhodopirellula sallentina]|uniref:Replication-associated recombination protein A n=1 Tax=Rhodopirellula sallentina SM41 TaxID=1263870 RepID=M5U3T4_9BACT|nr:replication-associated recombination protein A [Rhodopirellula sallentina]EMI56112.1 replication-associated recombination protein A [Rhodopirellula sallentina SM41]
MDLFAQQEADHLFAAQPLAARMRPKNLQEFVGQHHILGEGKLLRRLIASGRIGSIILHGPPGSGKTTLARLIAEETGSELISLNAINSGVKEVREVLRKATDAVSAGERRPILFIDEIHRFNKSQQDALLADVEAGVISLIGATTSNPHFAVNGALISRSQLFMLEPLPTEPMASLLRRAVEDSERGLGDRGVTVTDEAIEFLASATDGDARRALAAIEVAVESVADNSKQVDREVAMESLTNRVGGYDATGDDHYDLSSALIKSIRGSDVDAAIYWLARMLEGGEDIRFLCRRLVILASEDIGNADPQALPMAVAAMQACEMIGLPEAQLTLSQTVAYLSLAPKSNAATVAISAARRDVRDKEVIPVPKMLRDSHYSGSKDLGHGDGYLYAHDSEDGFVDLDYLGVDRQYYQPVNRGYEADMAVRLNEIRNRLRPQKETTDTDATTNDASSE